MARLAVATALSVLGAGTAAAELKTRAVEYRQGDTPLEGYLAYDDAVTGKRPGVMVAHEWWGLKDYPKRRAEQLAGMGYVAFAADIYGKGKTTMEADEAGHLAGVFRQDQAMLRARALAGLEVLLGQPGVDPERVAAIGYCFGGTTVLEMARANAPVAGVVSFHGGLKTAHPEATARIRPKVLVLQGADDPFVSRADVATFQDEMRRAGADWQMILYGGAMHGFTNPASDGSLKGAIYDPRADRRSWEHTKLFFAEIFR